MIRTMEASAELRRQLGANPEARPEGSRVEFEGRCFSATADQCERWRKAFPQIPDLTAELQVADDYYFENRPPEGKALGRLSRWLERANFEGRERVRQRDRERGRSW
jgi:hypothetical protein